MLNSFGLNSSQSENKPSRLCSSRDRSNNINPVSKCEYENDDGLEMVSSPSSASSQDDESVIECTNNASDIDVCNKSKLNHLSQNGYSPWTSPLSSNNATPTYTFHRQSLSSDEALLVQNLCVEDDGTLSFSDFQDDEPEKPELDPEEVYRWHAQQERRRADPGLINGPKYSRASYSSGSEKEDEIRPQKIHSHLTNMNKISIDDDKNSPSSLADSNLSDPTETMAACTGAMEILSENRYSEPESIARPSISSREGTDSDPKLVRSFNNSISQFKELDCNLKSDLIMQSKATGSPSSQSSKSITASTQDTQIAAPSNSPASSKSPKKFNWESYLRETKSIAAPAECFVNPFPSTKNQFKTGMCLEGQDPVNPTIISVLSVSEVLGHRLRLHFDGYDISHDFWRNCDSEFIYPVGFCAANGLKLMPPKGYNTDEFNWNEYLSDRVEAPKSLFLNNRRKNKPTRDFEVGMKLEVVDKRNPLLIRVATVVDLNAQKLRIHYDDWSSIYDIWVDKESEDIHPASWCEKTNHPLSTSTNQTVTYNRTNYNYSVNCPIAGCEGIGHIKGPKYTNHHTESGCPYAPRYLNKDVIGDRFQETSQPIFPLKRPIKPKAKPVNIKKPAVLKHKNQLKKKPVNETAFKTNKTETTDVKDSALSRLNVDKAKEEIAKFIQRNAEFQTQTLESSVSNKLVKVRGGTSKRSMKSKSNETSTDEYRIDKNTLQYLLLLNNVHESVYMVNTSEKNQETNPDLLNFNYDLNLLPGFNEYFQCLKKKKKIITTWNKDDVANFIKMIPGCAEEAEKFIQQEIDGEALMLIQQYDLIKLMKLKIGPAVKIFNYILMLKNLSVN